MTNIVLASASPRRAELLRQIGLKFLIRPSNIEERRASNEEPADYVHRLSQESAVNRTSNMPRLYWPDAGGSSPSPHAVALLRAHG